ncbi:MAG: hypothetical protein LBE25_10150 [Arthrobacter sp.]|jgi:uncharacterized integral membrane protein|nr:hypothetical protein [Arthrobacter sp.]
MKVLALARNRWVRVLAAILLTVFAAWSAFTFGHLADTMSWDCGGGSCATNDPRSLNILGAIAGTILACLVGALAVGLIGPALTIAAVSWAFRQGLRAAVHDGYSVASTLTAPLTLTTIGFIVSGLCLIGWIPMFISNRRLARRIRRRQAAQG